MTTENTDNWTSECPTVPGVYELKCDGVSGTLTREFSETALHLYHTRMTNPQWRPLKGVEPFGEDRAMEIINHVSEEFTDLGKAAFATPKELCETIRWLRNNTVDKSFDEAMSEQHAAQEKVIAQLDVATKLAESETRLAVAERQRDAWKGLAERLGDTLKLHRWLDVKEDREALAELEKLKTTPQ